MKQLLIFFIMLVCVFFVDLKAVSLSDAYPDTITVSVEGEVASPGSYELQPYATINEILEMAGVTDEGDMTVLNRESVLHEGDVIVVPKKAQKGEKERISINTADASALCQLPGIGPSTAERIVAFRNEQGSFQSLEDLLQVKGIGRAKFEKIKDLICL